MDNEIRNEEVTTETVEEKKVGFFKKVGTWIKGHKLATIGIGTGMIGAAGAVAKFALKKDDPEAAEDAITEAIETVAEEVTE